MSYRTYRSSGYGYERPTELTQVLCRVIPEVNTPETLCTYPTEHNREIFDPTAGVYFYFYDIHKIKDEMPLSCEIDQKGFTTAVDQ